jgi:hypothetical protein
LPAELVEYLKVLGRATGTAPESIDAALAEFL